METVDITPTWEAMVPVFIAVLRDGNEEGKKEVKAELLRMARALDEYNKQAKEKQ